MTPVDLLEEQDEAAAHSWSFFLWPRRWQSYADASKKDWKMVKLEKPNKKNIPKTSGIYSLLVQPMIADHPACTFLVYIGKSDDLNRRFGEYLNKEKKVTGRPKVFRILHKCEAHAWFCYFTIDMDALDEAEDKLLAAYLPPCNDSYPAEVRRVVGAF